MSRKSITAGHTEHRQQANVLARKREVNTKWSKKAENPTLILLLYFTYFVVNICSVMVPCRTYFPEVSLRDPTATCHCCF